MQHRMFQRLGVFAKQFPVDLPESLAIEKLQLAGEAVDKASVLCHEYEEQPADSQNSWGREKGEELQTTIEDAEKKISLVARFTDLRSQEFVLDMAERVRCLEEHMQVVKEVGESGEDGGVESIADPGGAENGEAQSEDESIVHSNGEDRSGAGNIAATVVWMLVGLFSATVLVRVGVCFDTSPAQLSTGFVVLLLSSCKLSSK